LEKNNMTQWSRKAIGEIVEHTPENKLLKGITYPYIAMENVIPQFKYPKQYGSKIFSGSGAKFSAGDTLYARITPCLQNKKITYATCLGFGSTEFFVFRAINGISDPEYIYYLLLLDDINKTAEISMTGASGRQRADINSILEYTTNIPILSIQKQLGSILYLYDSLIENNQKRIRILEEIAQQLYTEWFVKFNFPGHEKVKMIDSRSKYGLIPAGWEVKPLSQVVNINPQYKLEISNSVLHIPMECLSNSSSVIDSNKTFRNASRSGTKFMNGDTLFSRITPCLQNGKTGYVNILNENEVACGSTEYVVLSPKKLTSIYIYILSRTRNFRETAILTMVRASGRQRVRPEFFESYKTVVPDNIALIDFEKRVSKYFLEIKLLHRSNLTLSKIRDLLTPQLVTGRRKLKS